MGRSWAGDDTELHCGQCVRTGLTRARALTHKHTSDDTESHCGQRAARVSINGRLGVKEFPSLRGKEFRGERLCFGLRA